MRPARQLVGPCIASHRRRGLCAPSRTARDARCRQRVRSQRSRLFGRIQVNEAIGDTGVILRNVVDVEQGFSLVHVIEFETAGGRSVEQSSADLPQELEEARRR